MKTNNPTVGLRQDLFAMKYAINALFVRWGVNAGTETYVTNIVRPWYESKPSGCEFLFYCNQLPPWWKGDRPWFRAIVLKSAKRVGWRIFYEQLWLPLVGLISFDALFAPGYVGSALLQKPQAITVHDAFAWLYPGEIGLLRSLYWRMFIPLSLQSRNSLITVSASTATDLKRFCNIDSQTLHVIHEAGSHLSEINEGGTILERLGLEPGKYFHCVGFFKRIKNPYTILNAYRSYCAAAGSNSANKLVLVGHVGNSVGQEIADFASKIPGVILAGRLTDESLSDLYRNSAALIFASLYEGFGIPILEAQELGCPVITSRSSSMPEVAGDGALLVNERSVSDVAAALSKISEKTEAETLIRKGKVNYQKFSWQKASDMTLDVLRKVNT
ncbi:glycosyltransferase family 4 protein [Rhizobium lentis]|uniref:glycosyltransferase family 4 protein n=1 Tax=Rhizobium TaxID=379 RepID=UPI0012F4A261|nr:MULTISPECIES: glycosyltransferase family 1 protein [Rhizobium]MBX5180752.1 glycosyltransferase family 4 protein [Rhizobium lentis]